MPSVPLITLCPFRIDLLQDYFRNFVQDESLFMDMSRFQEYIYDPKRVEQYFEKRTSARDRVDFLVMLDDKPIGEVALKHINRKTSECELSIHLQNDHVKNKGYGTEAERLAIQYAFEILKLKTVVANTVIKNSRSQHVLEKIGFEQIGQDESFIYYRLEQANLLKTKKTTSSMLIKKFDDDFSVCKVADYSMVDLADEFCFIAKTDEESSLLCRSQNVPPNTLARDEGWKAFRIQAQLDFSLVGILAKLSTLLAENGIGIFAVSSFNTDYIFVKKENFEKALALLAAAGYGIL